MFNVIDMRNGSSNPLNWNSSKNGDWHLEENTRTLYYLGMYLLGRGDYFIQALSKGGENCLMDKYVIQCPVHRRSQEIFVEQKD